jgi:hypothetical protein
MAFSARPYLQQQQQQQQQRDGFGAFPKRVWSPRDVVSAARRDEARSSTADGLLHRRGRAPKPMVRTSLGAEARALLARMASDQPPGPSGFGSKVSIDGEHLLALFGGSKVPKWLEPTVEDTAHASIMSIVNQSDEAAFKCLKSLITEASKSMEQAESKAKLVEEKRTKASRESYDESVASVRGGRKRRSLLVGARGDDLRSSKDDAGGDVANLADLVDILEEHELSDEGDEGEGRGYDRRLADGGGGGGSAGAGAGDGDGRAGRAAGGVAGGSSGAVAVPTPSWMSMPLVPPVTQGKGPEEEEEEEEEEEGNHVRGRPSRLATGRLHRLIEGSPIAGNGGGGGALNHRSLPNKAIEELRSCGDLSEWPEVLPVTPDAIVALMKRVVFFKGAYTAHADCRRTLASWFEVQYVEPFTTIAEEGHWCHSFVLLHTGALEARGAPLIASARVGHGASISGNRHIQAEGGVDGRPLTKEERGLVRSSLDTNDCFPHHKRGLVRSSLMTNDCFPHQVRSSLVTREALPVPTVSGEFDALEPVLLLPGAHFGEQAFCTEMRPHTCSVRTDDH